MWLKHFAITKFVNQNESNYVIENIDCEIVNNKIVNGKDCHTYLKQHNLLKFSTVQLISENICKKFLLGKK